MGISIFSIFFLNNLFLFLQRGRFIYDGFELFCVVFSTILSSLAAMPDGQGAMENWFLGQNATGQTETPEELARQLAEVTPERIRAAAQSIRLDTVYFLKGKEAE